MISNQIVTSIKNIVQSDCNVCGQLYPKLLPHCRIAVRPRCDRFSPPSPTHDHFPRFRFIFWKLIKDSTWRRRGARSEKLAKNTECNRSQETAGNRHQNRVYAPIARRAFPAPPPMGARGKYRLNAHQNAFRRIKTPFTRRAKRCRRKNQRSHLRYKSPHAKRLPHRIQSLKSRFYFSRNSWKLAICAFFARFVTFFFLERFSAQIKKIEILLLFYFFTFFI